MNIIEWPITLKSVLQLRLYSSSVEIWKESLEYDLAADRDRMGFIPQTS